MARLVNSGNLPAAIMRGDIQMTVATKEVCSYCDKESSEGEQFKSYMQEDMKICDDCIRFFIRILPEKYGISENKFTRKVQE